MAEKLISGQTRTIANVVWTFCQVHLQMNYGISCILESPALCTRLTLQLNCRSTQVYGTSRILAALVEFLKSTETPNLVVLVIVLANVSFSACFPWDTFRDLFPEIVRRPSLKHLELHISFCQYAEDHDNFSYLSNDFIQCLWSSTFECNEPLPMSLRCIPSCERFVFYFLW